VIAPRDLPTHREIREQLRMIADHESDSLGGLAHDPSREQEEAVDRFRLYRVLLLPLEQWVPDLERFPEGDLLYHSLQVFELVRAQRDYDEELLLAALLHEVGQVLDRQNHVEAALANLDGSITERSAWLIRHHLDAQAIRAGTLGVRSRRRLEESPDYDELILLADCDRRGHVRGALAPDVDEALDYLRALDRDHS
jgi:hypothetical protein